MVEKILTYILFPPGGFVIALGISLFLWPRKPKVARALIVLTTLSLYLLSISPVAKLLLSPLEKPYQGMPKGKGDVIVVLGGGAYAHCKGEICLSCSSTKRIVRAYLLWKRTPLPVIVSGGRLRKFHRSEAEIMEEALKALGVKEVIREESSINTRQEAEEVGKIMREHGWSRAYLVTSAFHMRRAVFSFTARGIKVLPVATDFRASSQAFPLLPSTKALDDSFIALHEYAGLFYYWLRKILLPGNGP